MKAADLTRRSFVKQSALAAVTTLPLVSTRAEPAASLKVVCAGAHPDDPESACGGTLARYAALGHAVTIVYLTRGERGIAGKSLDEAARIRTGECEAACRIIGAKPVFFGQIDGATEINRPQVDAMQRLLASLSPDLLFTHWPVDTHMDHQVASMLTIRAWMGLRTPLLYFFEVDTGSQTEGFLPNTWKITARLAGYCFAAGMGASLLLCMIAFHGSRAWADCSWGFGTYHWEWMVMGQTSNLPGL